MNRWSILADSRHCSARSWTSLKVKWRSRFSLGSGGEEAAYTATGLVKLFERLPKGQEPGRGGAVRAAIRNATWRASW